MMSHHKCNKSHYTAFLRATSVRYSCKTLSEVSPDEMSHDSVSRWLGSQHIRPHELWQQVSKGPVNTDNRCLLVVDDTLADKRYSKKIDIVSRQYSGNEHSVISGIGIVNLLWLEKESGDYCPIDCRIYD